MTFVEAFSWRGLDNLFVPLGGFLLLQRLLAMDVRSIVTMLVVTSAVTALVVSVQRPARDRLRGNALSTRGRSIVA
jgi:hypothetical protein